MGCYQICGDQTTNSYCLALETMRCCHVKCTGTCSLTVTYTHTHTHTDIHTCPFSDMHTCVRTHTHTHQFIHIHTHTYRGQRIDPCFSVLSVLLEGTGTLF